MTHTEQAPRSTRIVRDDTTDAMPAPAPSSTTPRPSRPRAGTVAVIVIGLVMILAVALLIVSAVVRSQVISFQDARPVSCSNQAQSTVPTLDPDTASQDDTYYSALELDAGIDCSLRFFVTNTSAIPAQVTGVDLGLLNPDGSGALSVVGINGELTADIASPDTPARFARNYTLQPGETQYFQMELDFVPDVTCMMGDGGFTFVANAPTILVSALGIEGQHDGLPGGFALVGTDDTASNCG